MRISDWSSDVCSSDLGSALTTGSSADPPLLLAQRGLAFVAGLLMVFIGLQFLGYFRSLHGTALGLGGQIAASSLQGLLKTPNPGAPLAFGVFNGFLPCPLVSAFLAHTAALCLHSPSPSVPTAQPPTIGLASGRERGGPE